MGAVLDRAAERGRVKQPCSLGLSKLCERWEREVETEDVWEDRLIGIVKNTGQKGKPGDLHVYKLLAAWISEKSPGGLLSPKTFL